MWSYYSLFPSFFIYIYNVSPSLKTSKTLFPWTHFLIYISLPSNSLFCFLFIYNYRLHSSCFFFLNKNNFTYISDVCLVLLRSQNKLLRTKNYGAFSISLYVRYIHPYKRDYLRRICQIAQTQSIPDPVLCRESFPSLLLWGLLWVFELSSDQWLIIFSYSISFEAYSLSVSAIPLFCDTMDRLCEGLPCNLCETSIE